MIVPTHISYVDVGINNPAFLINAAFLKNAAFLENQEKCCIFEKCRGLGFKNAGLQDFQKCSIFDPHISNIRVYLILRGHVIENKKT